MRKTVPIDADISAFMEKVQEVLAALEQVRAAAGNISMGGQGVPGSGLSGTFTTAAAPGVNPATSGSVGMSGGSASIGVPASVSPGAPSMGVFGPGFGTGSMGQVPGMGPGYFGGMGIGGTPANVSMPANSNYNFQAPFGAAPDQTSWSDDASFGWVRGHFRRFPGQASGGGNGSAQALAGASFGQDGDGGAGGSASAAVGAGFGGGGGSGGGSSSGGGGMGGASISPANVGGGGGNGGGGSGAGSGGGSGSGAFGAYMSFRTVREFARGAADLVNEGTRYAITGDGNPLALGTGIGQLAGGAIGLGLAATGIGLPIAGAVGLVAGPLIGAGINAAQAPTIQRTAVAGDLSSYANITGQNAVGLASDTAKIASQQNTAFGASDGDRYQNTDPISSGIRNAMRRWGMLPSDDKISPQDVGKIEQSVGNAALSNGQIMTPAELREASGRFTSMGGALGVPAAQTYGAAKAQMAASGDNLFSLANRVGIAGALSVGVNDGLLGGIDSAKDLTSSVADYQSGQYALRITAADVGAATANFDAGAFSGRRTSARSGDLRDMLGSIDADISRRYGVRSDLSRTSAGRGSAEFRENERSIREDVRDQAQARGNFARGIVGDVEAVGALNLSSSQFGATAADLYGTADQIRTAGSGVVSTLTGNALAMNSAANTPNLPFADQQRARTAANAFQTQALQQRASVAGSAMRRTFMGQDINIATFQADITGAELYGSDDDLGKVAGGAVAGQDFIANDAIRASRDPALSAADKAAAQVRAAGARQASLNIRARSRDTLLGRISGRAGIAETDAGNALISAQYGDENDSARAGAGVISALGDEKGKLQGQIAAGGLSVEQEIRTRQRISTIEGEQLKVGISTRDEVIHKVETGAGLANQAADNELNRALKLGTGSDVRGAAGGLLQSLGNEAGKLQAQLNQGNLTFDQRAGIQSRLQTISKQAFDVGQDAIDQGFQRDDMAGYGIASIRNSTQRALAQLMPFGGGDRLTANVNTIRTDQQQLGVLRNRYSALQQSGNLSPERAYELEQKGSQLQVDIGQGVANLSEGMENYLPNLSAGRGANFQLFDSKQLAALRYYKRGSTIRDSGAINGDQEQQQAAAWVGMTGGTISGAPHSLTQGLNSGGTGGIEILLMRMISLMERGGNADTSHQNVRTLIGQSHAQHNMKELGQGYGGQSL